MTDVQLYDRISLMLDRVEGVAYVLGELGSAAGGDAEARGLNVLADMLFSEAGNTRDALRQAGRAETPTRGN